MVRDFSLSLKIAAVCIIGWMRFPLLLVEATLSELAAWTSEYAARTQSTSVHIVHARLRVCAYLNEPYAINNAGSKITTEEK